MFLQQLRKTAIRFDVLVLMDEPAAVGCLLQRRVVRFIAGEPGSKKNRERNDRIVAIECANHGLADIGHVKDLGKEFVCELEEFFVNYHDLADEKYRIVDVKGPREAVKRIDEGIRAFKKS